jgi:hypothetical protein
VPTQYIRDNGGTGWLAKYNDSLIAALKDIYPHHKWKPALKRAASYALTTSKSQHILHQMVVKMFPDMPVLSDYWYRDYHTEFKRIQFDIYFPTLSLALEYNGEPHCIYKSHIRACCSVAIQSPIESLPSAIQSYRLTLKIFPRSLTQKSMNNKRETNRS